MKKTKGFTLIELIVVIAIIGVLAAILIPAMLGYVRDSRLSRMNANAKQIHNAAQLAITDCYLGGGALGSVYTGNCTNPVASASDGDDCYLEDYLGTNIEGYFLFVTDNSGSCVYAYWCDKPISASNDMGMLTKDETFATLTTPLPVGCFPLKGDGST